MVKLVKRQNKGVSGRKWGYRVFVSSLVLIFWPDILISSSFWYNRHVCSTAQE